MLKNLLKISDTGQDQILKTLLKQSEEIIERKIGYSLKEKKYHTIINAENTAILFLEAPILSIENLSKGEVKYYRKNVLYLKKSIQGEVEIQYTGGMKQVTESITLAMVGLAKELYQIRNTKGLEIKSKKIETLSITYFSPEEQQNGSVARTETDLWAVLAPYKLLSCYSI